MSLIALIICLHVRLTFFHILSKSYKRQKKITSKIDSYSSICDVVLGNSKDALSWHTSNNDYGYAVALPFPVSFVRKSITDSCTLIGAKCNEYHEVQTCNYGALEISIWSGDEMKSYSDKSVSSVNLFANLYTLYSPQYVPSLC